MQIVFLLHRLAVARLHRLLRQVGLAAPASDGKWWGLWLGDALVSLTHLPSRSLEAPCVLGSLGGLHSFASPLLRGPVFPPAFPPLPLALLGPPQFQRVGQNLKICSCMASRATIHLFIMVRRRGQVDWRAFGLDYWVRGHAAVGGDGGRKLLRVLLLQMECQQLDMLPQEPGNGRRFRCVDLADGWHSPLAAEKTEGVPIWRGCGGDGTRQGRRSA